MHDEQLAKEGSGTTFSEPREQDLSGTRTVQFEARRGQRSWTFQVTEPALKLANQGSLQDGDLMATFRHCEQWLHNIAETYVEGGHATDQPIVLTDAAIMTSDDR